MRRDEAWLDGGTLGARRVIAHGHYGRPFLAFPTDMGAATDFEERGMLDSVGRLVEGGRAKIYCLDSFDRSSWRNSELSLEQRARAHLAFEAFVVDQVVPLIHRDCGGPQDVGVLGFSFGAFHAANFCLRRADLFPLSLCFSGVYDVSVVGGGWERGDTAYFNNPMDYMRNAEGDHLDWLRRRCRLLLVCGQGAFEDTTGALQSTRDFAALLQAKGLPCELDLWGWDVPHDWPSWGAQLAHHLPRFC